MIYSVIIVIFILKPAENGQTIPGYVKITKKGDII